MRLIDIVTSPWAIVPEKLLEIRSIYETHLKGEKIDIKSVEARIGKPLNNQTQDYEIVDGVAIIPVDGVIAKRANLFTYISGGLSTELLARDIKAALDDPQVKSIILNIDSPGGTVDGTADLANAIFEARGEKPIVAFTDGMMCSAAYWIGSAADKLYIGNDTTLVGSIGVVATHTDISQAEAQRGIKTTEIYAGKYKRIASQYTPLTDEGKASIQERVDYLYSVFVSAVAQNRGASEETVLSDMADGRTFSGKQAVAAGLVDGVSTLDALIADLSSGGVPDNRRSKTKSQEGNMAGENKAAEAATITAELIAEKHPDVFKAIEAQGYKKGEEEGAKAERERIQGVFSTYRPGREETVKALMFDGKSTKADASVAILAAEDAKREAYRKDLKEDAGDAKVPAAEPGDVAAGADKNLPLEERAKAEWEKDAGLRAEFNDKFEAFLAYKKNAEAGRARILAIKGGK